MEKTKKKLIRQAIGAGSLGVTALLYIISGISFLIWKTEVPQFIKLLVFIYTLVMGLTGILGCLAHFSVSRLVRGLMPVVFGFVFFRYLESLSSLYALFIGFYIAITGIIKLIDYFLQRKDKTPGRSMVLFSVIVIFLLALPLLFDPKANLQRAFLITGLFCLFYGFSLLGDFFVEVSPIRQTNRFKKRIRINLPVFMTMLMPKKAVDYINSLLAVDDDGILEEQSFKQDQIPDLEIFVHVTEEGFGTMGHGDLYFDGRVYCYGNYDHLSGRLFGSIGDGVLFTAADRDQYIRFCAASTGDSIFAFGLSLNETQKKAVILRLQELFTHTIPWQCQYQKYQEGKLTEEPDDYASKLCKETKADMFKFKDTSFKTYFVLTTNCVKLTDTVIRSTGLAAANPNGILTPGAYYDYFERQYRLQNSIVISKRTYHHNALIDHE